jgi:hypothetical protein
MAANSNCPPLADSVFGPVVEPCARKFDFTFLFENTILSILPSSIFLLVACWRLLSRRSARPKVAGKVFRLVKLVGFGLSPSLNRVEYLKEANVQLTKTDTNPCAPSIVGGSRSTLGEGYQHDAG